MSSLVSGYEYDIFISYRQKDNRYDGWVSKFVENLKGELEATFKEEVSVYFDINSHDGILETHDVDASLRDKLRCLVFIPIISQTYCDPKSYAWQNEFVTFNKIAQEDPIGRDIRLSNGNVSSRILPVKIHDLDPDDNKLLEDVIGGTLRSIEFIYRSPGVNRPLLTHEDHPYDNLAKKYYRDQINKVANATKEIITTILKHDRTAEKTSNAVIMTAPRSEYRKYIVSGFIILSVLIIGYFLAPKRPNLSANPKKSIAVLPFINKSNDPEQGYFSDGLTDGILNSLAHLRELKIIARTSTLRFRNRDPREAGKELKVQLVLGGSVQKQGDDFRINVWLVDTESGIEIWSQQYDESTDNIFDVQDRIANSIAENMEVTFLGKETLVKTKKPTHNREAYEMYLKGRYFWNQGTVSGIDKGIDYFLDAISLDRRFAAAYAGLADCYTTLGYASIISPEEAIVKARNSASKALEIDSALAEVHASVGFFTFYYDWDWVTAEKEFKTSILLNPNNGLAYSWYSYYLTAMEKYNDAKLILEKARDLDPLSFKIATDMGFILYYSGDYDMAINELEGSLELNSNYGLTHLWLARTYQEKKLYDNAIVEYRETMKILPDWPVALAGIGNAYGEAGNIPEAQKILDTLNLLRQNQFVTAYGIALVHAGMGDSDSTFKWLNKAYDERSNWLVWLKTDPRWDVIRSDERYAELVRKVGLPE
jgi:TolB-like protein/Tfp pilus assembly protein PilF